MIKELKLRRMALKLFFVFYNTQIFVTQLKFDKKI